MYRFFENIELENLESKEIISLNYNNSHKIINVLKLQNNQEIYLFNNTNCEFLSKIVDISYKQKIVYVKLLNSTNRDLESKLQIHLIQSIAKNDNMDFIIQKSTELGVTQITPIISERTIVKPKNYVNRTKHWEAIALGACCQCGRNLLPTINPITAFKDFIKTNAQQLVQQDYLKLILSPTTGTDTSIAWLFNKQHLDYQKIYIMIGPEGGFSLEELNIAKQNGFYLSSLGPRILRTETAPIVIISILQAKFGDLLKS